MTNQSYPEKHVPLVIGLHKNATSFGFISNRMSNRISNRISNRLTAHNSRTLKHAHSSVYCGYVLKSGVKSEDEGAETRRKLRLHKKATLV